MSLIQYLTKYMYDNRERLNEDQQQAIDQYVDACEAVKASLNLPLTDDNGSNPLKGYNAKQNDSVLDGPAASDDDNPMR